MNIDPNIIYHLIFFGTLFTVLAAFCRRSILLALLLILPVVGEYIQPILAKLPDRFHLWFAFEYKDIFVNFIGALIGIGLILIISLFHKK